MKSLESSFLLKAMIPPKAEVGSVLYAYYKHHLYPYLLQHHMDLHVLPAGWFFKLFYWQESALSESTILLNDNSLPATCS